MRFCFSPATQADLVIAELPFEDTINLIADEDTPHDIRIAGTTYQVNIGASRLRMFKQSGFTCACCGIRATEATLDLDAQNTAQSGSNKYHVNFYARSGDPKNDREHLVLFTKDHVIPRSNGGADDNSNAQTLCFNCNCLKDNTQLDLEHMRKALFPAYRAYASAQALNLAKEALQKHYFMIDKHRKGIENITKALEIVKDERAEGMKKKIEILNQRITYLTDYCRKIEHEAQVSGVGPVIVEEA
jgi:hypothetical protein